METGVCLGREFGGLGIGGVEWWCLCVIVFAVRVFGFEEFFLQFLDSLGLFGIEICWQTPSFVILMMRMTTTTPIGSRQRRRSRRLLVVTGRWRMGTTNGCSRRWCHCCCCWWWWWCCGGESGGGVIRSGGGGSSAAFHGRELRVGRVLTVVAVVERCHGQFNNFLTGELDRSL